MCALAQRIRLDSGEGDVDRLPVPRLADRMLGEPLERVEAKLAQTLTLDQHPVVVPVGQDVAVQLGALEFAGVFGMLEEAARERGHAPYVDDHRA